MLRLGSLCTGYGGLDLAAEHLLGPLDHTWHAEIDPHASKVLAHHWPATPNLGDLTAVDWTRVPAVDVLTAGYPCQPLSLAGRRAGLDDERWIWDDVFAAIRDLRPRLVLLENVAGHLSLGFGRVLGDLASAGFDAEWGCFRASDVGAPHRRERVFIAAWPAADTESLGHGHPGPPRLGGVPAAAVGGGARPDGRVTLLPTPVVSDRNGAGVSGAGGLDLRTAISLLPTPTAKCAEDSQTHRSGARSNELLLTGVAKAHAAGALLQTPTVEDASRNGSPEWAARWATGEVIPETQQRLRTQVLMEGTDRWGAYAPAIARWEATTGRTAPDPTETGTKGQPRLAPAFVEWLMGLPVGWVTDHLPRNPALKCLGNGVVWQQAAHAYAELLACATSKPSVGGTESDLRPVTT